MDTMTNDTIDDALESVARKLADSNRVAEAWYLRGIADGLLNRGCDATVATDPHYGRFYRRGYADGQDIDR